MKTRNLRVMKKNEDVIHPLWHILYEAVENKNLNMIDLHYFARDCAIRAVLQEGITIPNSAYLLLEQKRLWLKGKINNDKYNHIVFSHSMYNWVSGPNSLKSLYWSILSCPIAAAKNASHFGVRIREKNKVEYNRELAFQKGRIEYYKFINVCHSGGFLDMTKIDTIEGYTV